MVCRKRQGRQHLSVAYGFCFVSKTSLVLTGDCQRFSGRSLDHVSDSDVTLVLNIQAKVSSILTISRADVSMKPQPLLRAHSQAYLAETKRASFRSHLLPATIMTGGNFQPSSRLPLTRVPFSRNSRLFSSIRFSASMLIMSRNHARPSSELGFVIS